MCVLFLYFHRDLNYFCTAVGLYRETEEFLLLTVYSQRNGKHGFEISQEGEKLFQSTIFNKISPNAKYQKAKWFKEDSLGQGIPAYFLLKKCISNQTATTEPAPINMRYVCSEKHTMRHTGHYQLEQGCVA